MIQSHAPKYALIHNYMEWFRYITLHVLVRGIYFYQT